MNTAQLATGRFVVRDDAPSPLPKLVAVAGLAIFGDFALFGHWPGLGAALFVALVEAACVISARASRRVATACALIALATLAPLIENGSGLSIGVAIFGAGGLALFANGGRRGNFADMSLRVLLFLGVGPSNIFFDLPSAASLSLRGGCRGRALIGWLLPIGMGAVFLALFSVANPVIESWLAYIDLSPLLALFDLRRVAFWLMLAAAVWPFVLFRAPAWDIAVWSRSRASADTTTLASSHLAATIFGANAILRSLVLFNLMFAVQTALDATILWGGGSLPAGLSFAAYAHRGAYPLVATALLAGAFVVLVMRRGAAVGEMNSIRRLVFLWVGQNVALVVSSLYRLKLYVDVYALTYWRLAAFVWIALVAVGLVLIVVQLSTRRSNRWLLSANAVASAVALYLCALANFDYLIADFNLHHCVEVARESAGLDLGYLQTLGPDAIPALDAALAAPGSPFAAGVVPAIRSSLETERESRDDDWRSWTFRAWRLSRKLEAGAASNP